MLKDITGKKKAQLIAGSADDTKAKDVLIMDMRKLSNVCDYFVIASGDSTTHLNAIADNMAKSMSEKGIRAWHREGRAQALWIVMDYGDVVAHIFHDQTRGFYNLEKLWNDAPRVLLSPKGSRDAKKKKASTGRKKKGKASSAKKGASSRKKKKQK